MKNKAIIVLVLLSQFISACKKHKLEGEDEKYAGTWRWVGSTGGIVGGGARHEPGYNRKLVILQKGKYKYDSDSEKLGHGIITRDGAYYQFLNRELFGDDDLDKKKIIWYQGDTMGISRGPCCDTVFEIFVKEK